MRKKGQSTDAAVLQEVLKKPGTTISEIAKDLDCTNGKVDGSVNRLVSEGKASIKHYLKKGMLVKTVYPADFQKKPANRVEIPCEIVDSELWTKKAFVYALSRSTIGLAHQEVAEWEAKALSKEVVPIRKKPASVMLELPERIVDFYQLENSDISLSAVGNLVFLTVESVLPVIFPAKNSEEPEFAVARHQTPKIS
jgi:predicted transcriptional regulator